MITIYTDGSSRGNPGPGGFGAIIISSSEGKVASSQVNETVIEIGGREDVTTNNRMELRAAIEALRCVPEGGEVEIHSDSEYVIKGITLWVDGWQKNGWRTKAKKDVLNKDLWEQLVVETEKRKVIWNHVRGHADNELNNRCDVIATSFADNSPVKLYEGPRENYFVSK